jgi:two-component system alkaline phosphatase synthesis response regulator PhoP
MKAEDPITMDSRLGSSYMRVLLIEDDRDIAKVLRFAFERDRHEVTVAEKGTEGLHVLETWSPDLVMLDLTLPDLDGRDVLRELRKTSDVPVIIVSARTEESDRILGLEIGSDDYIVKPFSVHEVVARARAVVRRTHPKTRSTDRVLEHGDLSLDTDEHKVHIRDDPVALTGREFQVLRLLLEQPGKLVTRDDLAHSVWGLSATAASRSIDVCVSSIRRKLGDDPKTPRYIETVRGVGFRLAGAGD